jgi:hypothetical protein
MRSLEERILAPPGLRSKPWRKYQVDLEDDMFALVRDGICICRSSDRVYLEKILRCQRTLSRLSNFLIKTIS